MSQKAIYTFAKWQVKEGELQSVLNLLPELVEKSTSEEGNLFYKIHQSVADTNTIILWEAYKDEAALEAHKGSEHFNQLVIQRIVPLLEKREVAITHELPLQ